MIKNIMIVSSDFTGHGHKSITDSLTEQLSRYPDVKIHVVDGFALAGNMGVKVGKLYGSVTRNAKEVWKFLWDISLKKPSLICELAELSIRDSFLEEFNRIKPDLILCVHPNFNGSILNILEKHKINTPFVTLIADLISIAPLWADKRADFTICPTKESKYKCLEFGVPESKLKIIGFPSREKFCKHLTDDSFNAGQLPGRYPDKPLECLIMSGGEGVGNMRRVAQILLANFNCNVSIIAGRNKLLRTRLETFLTEKYGGRVKVYGFVENVQDLMLASDITFARGSPNVMMEAVLCGTPLVITGALPGQEAGNPGYAEKYNLGVSCPDLRKLKGIVAELLENNGEGLASIREAQCRYRNPNIAKEIAEFILSVEKKNIADYAYEAATQPVKRYTFRAIVMKNRIKRKVPRDESRSY